MTRISFLIAVAIAAITIGAWAMFNQPQVEPPWPERVQGFSFSPMRAEHDPIEKKLPTLNQIEADLVLLQGKAHAVRTYIVEGAMGEVPRLAAKVGLNVALGAWLTDDTERNNEEVERLVNITRNHTNVVRVIVGNEVLLREDMGSVELMAYLDRVRQQVWAPVSTAEPWHVWANNPELVEHVDYLAVHMLPYWEGIDFKNAVGHIVNRMEYLSILYPDKPIVIAEVGWPSNGRARSDAGASVANQAKFLRRFLEEAERRNYVYYVMEAFDQPWKRRIEGTVGAYWGVYDVERRAKFEFTAPVVAIKHWHVLAAMSVVVALITFTMLLIDSRTLRSRGRSFLGIIAYAAATLAVWAVYDYTNQYLTTASMVIGVLLMLGMIGVLLIIFAEAHEWAEALWVKEKRRPFCLLPLPDAELPMVSIHVPAYNEPPDMMIETLAALARLEYPNYEVIVIDNNTKDPSVWKPVQNYCAQLGSRFRFFHVDPLAGFKAGALNFALKKTSPKAKVIAVIDSDYVVDPHWLRDLAPQFSMPNVGIVQAPQDYRDGKQSVFKSMCYDEYRGFFSIGMITRNERNAIIQHGTMTMVSREVLDKLGGWGEWCITEDAELGLRVFKEGYDAVYIDKSYGRGLMPDTFIDFKKQRIRWAYGATQIMRRHLLDLSGFGKNKLTRGQRYHFVAGWLPWVADGFNFIFTLGALAWSIGMIIDPRNINPPPILFAILPMLLFVFKFAKILYLYRSSLKASIGQTLSAAIAGLALSHAISLAMLNGLFTKSKPFFRTPKKAKSHALARAFMASSQEVVLMLALWTVAIAVSLRPDADSFDMLLWIGFLAIQSLPYLATFVVALISALPERRVTTKEVVATGQENANDAKIEKL